MAGTSRLDSVVLVHVTGRRGAAHGAWCWEEMVPLLQAMGCGVSTLDLRALDDDPTARLPVCATERADFGTLGQRANDRYHLRAGPGPPARHSALVLRTRGGREKRIMDTDHSPFYSDPVGLAQIIKQEARL